MNELADAFAAADALKGRCDALVEEMKVSKTLTKRAALIYRCETRGCALLYVYNASGVLFAYQPSYKLSREVNERESVAEARAKHTRDGDRHWKDDTIPLDLAGGTLSLECDHCRAKVHVETIATEVAAATRLPATIKLPHNSVC